MASGYDLYVSATELERIREKLQAVKNDMYRTVDVMRDALQSSSEYLSGNQYDKAAKINNDCLSTIAATGENIDKAIVYLDNLLDIVQEYDKCIYQG